VSSVLSPPPSFCIISPRRRCLRWKTLKLCIFSSRVHFLDYLSPLSITRKNSHLCGIQVDTPTPFFSPSPSIFGIFPVDRDIGLAFSIFRFLLPFFLCRLFTYKPLRYISLFCIYLFRLVCLLPMLGHPLFPCERETYTHTHTDNNGTPALASGDVCPTLLSRLFAWPFSPATLHYLQ
jgi:hypothetical protein